MMQNSLGALLFKKFGAQVKKIKSLGQRICPTHVLLLFRVANFGRSCCIIGHGAAAAK
jgi:hypothetical protein